MANVHPARTSEPPTHLGRYRLIAKLGEGGMGTIHLAVTAGLGGFRKLFVLKVLKEELASNDSFLEMFMLEARVAARLNHPNVVHTIEADCDDGRFYLAMEFLDGQPFNTILRRAASAPEVPLALRLQVLCHALSGLHYAHELRDYDGRVLQVIHRDVSPSNIFVTYDGQVKVLDFGIAKASDAEATQPGSFKGKISYAAPEQLRSLPADPRIDVFAAGIVLWEAVTLRHLVQGGPSRRAFEARLAGTEPRLSEVVPDVDPALAAICERAMCVDREQRYQSAEALREDLQNYLWERKQALGPGAIAQILRTKFAEERRALHKVIETQLESFWNPDPITTTHARRSAELGAEWPDLASAERTRAGRLHRSGAYAAAATSGFPRQRSQKSLLKRGLFLGMSALAALAVRYQLREGAPARSTLPSAAEELKAPPAQQAAMGAAEPSFASPDAPLPSLHDAAVDEHVTPEPVAPERRAADETAVAEGRGSKAAPPQTSKVSPPQSAPRMERRPAPERGAAEPRQEKAKVENRPARAPAAHALDVDLRKIEHPVRRPLDVDNPFQ